MLLANDHLVWSRLGSCGYGREMVHQEIDFQLESPHWGIDQFAILGIRVGGISGIGFVFVPKKANRQNQICDRARFFFDCCLTDLVFEDSEVRV